MHGSPHIVSDVMTHTVVAVGRDVPFKEIVSLMSQGKVSALPVLEGEGRVIGVVSEADLLPKEEIRREIVSCLFPAPLEPVHVGVVDGVVTLTGRIRDTSLVPVAARLVRAVEGVVDVECDLASGPAGAEPR
ncbi:CBS domain-containing protein [Streptomyces sp. NPDC017179]|uniref:CBS domain-containing protein n=1 Tax=Streptomyces sp. NPDC017179 TaxID=3364979 RepID=UPI0037AE2254